MVQESLAWMLSKPFIISPIVGATSVAHIEETVSALDIRLDEDEIKALEAPLCHTSKPAHSNIRRRNGQVLQIPTLLSSRRNEVGIFSTLHIYYYRRWLYIRNIV